MIIKYDLKKKNSIEEFADKGKKYLDETADQLQNEEKKRGKAFQQSASTFWSTPFGSILRKNGLFLYKTFPWINILVFIIVEGAKLWRRYYAEFLSVFALTFVSLPLLVLLFERTPVIFFLCFLPIVILNTLALSTVYRYIDNSQRGEKTSLRQSFHYTCKRLLPITLLISFYIFLATATIIVFLGIAWGLSAYLTQNHIDWFRQYYYWLIILSIGTFLASLFFILILLAQHVYYAFLLDRANPREELKNIIPLMKHYYVATFPLFFLVLLFFIPIMFWLSISYLDVGVGLLLLCIFHATFLFSYLLRKRLLGTSYAENTTQKTLPRAWFVTGFILGTVSYLMCMGATIMWHATLMQFINRLQQDRAIEHQLITYMNTTYGYTIDYPRRWSVYQWQPNVTTLFDNNTGTFIGGVWVNISVTYAKKTNYQKLYNAKNGTSIPNPELNITTVKLTNFTMQNQPGVKYSVTKSDFPLSEYETHYQIKKDNLTYDISFVTKSKDIEADNQMLFEKMLESFRFIPEK
jgi:hypothetical protein